MAAEPVMRAWIPLLAMLAASAAHARDENERLAFILAPNNAQPAIVRAGDTFSVVVRSQVPLRIESAAGTIALSTAGARPWRGNWIVEATVPSTALAGAYTLVAEDPDTRDSVYRAVYVLAETVESYRVAHVTNLRAGDPQRPDSRLFRLTAALNEGAPDLILVTGNLTATGAEDEFRLAMDVLNDCRAPTFVAPGDADNGEGLLQAYLGEYPAALWFGDDGYLLCPPPALLSPGNDARLHVARRAIRAARWSIGVGAEFSHRDSRTALTLFVDDPLDYVVYPGPADVVEAWGRTRRVETSGDMQIRWFVVGPRGAAPADPARE